ncbi:hypothetical protein KSP40_PGU007103 [Platanthera guangdongensis]|uniref:Myb/SANT-like DNA-binding domain-containing protein n=1 Tax=Platanthera guangdongensis TaxID=2320717 RepID=A0ABR2M929_9ASPA
MDFGNCTAAGGGGTGGGREDCWSEGATEALVEAWGDRFLHLSRGNLRQNDWKDVGDSVNARQDAAGKPRKTSGQCKNRIDTLKKKYKLEKSKPGPSTWPLLSRLDLLVGTSPDSSSKKKPISIRVKQLNPNSTSGTPPPSLLLTSWGSSRVRTNFPDATQSSREGSGIGCDGCDGVEHMNRVDGEGKVGLFKTLAPGKRRQPCCGSEGFSRGALGGVGGDHEDFRDLARAIERIAEIYERVERSKLQQSIELEKQRMEFEKELEIQRMRLFTEMLLELEKVKRPKYASDSGSSLSLL